MRVRGNACRHEPRSRGLVSFRPALLGPVHKPLLTSFLSPFQRAFVPLWPSTALNRILACSSAILGELGATMSHFSPRAGRRVQDRPRRGRSPK